VAKIGESVEFMQDHSIVNAVNAAILDVAESSFKEG
jgi:hypothetical protein